MGNTANHITIFPFTEDELFDRFVSPEPNSGCWLWLGRLTQSLYGEIYLRGKRVGAHRYIWVLRNGRDIPDGMQIHHSCDNSLCVNPEHLSVGTNQKNAIDMVVRGRNKGGVLLGESNSNAKLTEPIVKEILRSECSASTLAKRYGVSKSAVTLIRRGINWPHVLVAGDAR